MCGTWGMRGDGLRGRTCRFREANEAVCVERCVENPSPPSPHPPPAAAATPCPVSPPTWLATTYVNLERQTSSTRDKYLTSLMPGGCGHSRWASRRIAFSYAIMPLAGRGRGGGREGQEAVGTKKVKTTLKRQ